MSNKNSAIVCSSSHCRMLLKHFAVTSASQAFGQVGCEQREITSHTPAPNLHSQDKSVPWQCFPHGPGEGPFTHFQLSFSWETKAPLG